jgi:MoaA/NifB/PqqE/SkfB family radical SAM enzyme
MSEIKNRLNFPTILQFEPIQLCNAACFCCPYSWLKDDKEYLGKRMSREQIINVIHQFGQPLLDNNYSTGVINPFRYSDPLVCKDLELIFKESIKYNIKIRITTNGVSLTDKNIKLLEKYSDHLAPITISIIGSTQEDVKNYMEVNLNKTIEKLKLLSERKSTLLKYLIVGIKTVTNTVDEEINSKNLRDKIIKLGINCKIKKSWETNRLGGHKTFKDKKIEGESRYVNGCGLTKSGSIFKNVHVMVDGDIVLCCDDATKEKTFGNIFKDGLLNTWNGPLKKEQELIYNKNWDKEKESLICNNCSRAIFSK